MIAQLIQLIRRRFIALLVASIVLSQILLVTIGAVIVSSHFNAITANQNRSLIEGCERLNILRVQDNLSHLADFHVFTLVAGIVHFDGLTPVLRGAIVEKTWTPLTDCRQAVNQHGVAYRPPRPVSFTARMPPLSALTPPS